MKNNLNFILEQVVKVLMVFVTILILIGLFRVGKQFLAKLQTKVVIVQVYNDDVR
jgi:hypothetical protein